ncbi:uncharacterized protein LOC131048039 [Cryptomeria japonica]|uniref:uncharacterized protein LOC131048039 n=1 Tax=Cryptomeria japonica TaxID=3369 RepID=UPI0027DA96DC|nr:uncharacterized protein LOC131048039 [Cryptomeria japonica]XP_059063082.1 uncharacterized protein LOC131048039 [Cryptomeria japonica]XP_059063083.1 uncharacterized protein LOC131048039 [Cryptomeria japonica]
MGKSSCCLASDIHWGVSAELSDSEFDAEENLDEEVESLYFSEVIPKLQFRKDVSVARWDNNLGMAEVIIKKGRMWSTTGIVRGDKILCHIEEIIYMVERGALLLLDGDLSLSMEDVYSLLMDGKYGCSWEYYQAYCHLRGLGYIVGRHDIPWTFKVNKSKPTACSLDTSEGLFNECGRDIGNTDISNEDKHCFQSNFIITTRENEKMLLKDVECCSDGLETTSLNQDSCKVEVASLEKALQNLSICRYSIDSGDHGKGLNLVFDVYNPNTKFKKSAPGSPDFILCITRDCPPNKAEVQALQSLCKGTPLKFASNECGRISFFSFCSVNLPVLP